MKRVTKNESKIARKYAHKLLEFMHKPIRSKYRFTPRLVGSAKWNIIIKDSEGWWDLDYQILLTKKSKKYKENELKDATAIKLDFFNYFNEKYKGDNNIKVENSTTAITLINKANKYSIDFVIIKIYPDNKEIIRRNNNDISGKNNFTWNELPEYNQAYTAFKSLSPKDKQDLIENYILPKKDAEKKKDDNDPTKKSSSQVFIEEVNNYVYKRKNS